MPKMPDLSRVVIPPDDCEVVAHNGSLVIDIFLGEPLPCEAICWSWEGLPQWHDADTWLWGIYEAGEAEVIREQEIASARAKAEANRFDERGRVDNLANVDPSLFPTRKPRPVPDLPPGVVLPEWMLGDDGDGNK